MTTALLVQSPATDLQNDIGIAAGDIWRYLDAHGEASTLQLRSSLKLSHTLLFLALGWLAREGKVRAVHGAGGYRVSLS